MARRRRRGLVVLGLVPVLLGAGVAHAAERADLVEVSVSKPPGSVAAGMGFTAKDKVKNAGGRRAGRSATGYYLSKDRKRSKGDVRLGRRQVPRLKPGKASAGSRAVVVPAGLAFSRYYLIACADDKKAIREAKEGNNCRASRSRVRVRAPTCREQMTLLGMEYTRGPATLGIADPVTVHPPIAGVTYTVNGNVNKDILMDCSLSLVLHEMTTGLLDLGVDEVEHFGVYNYRCNIDPGPPPDCPSGLSQHAYGTAIDLVAFSVGEITYDLEDDWDAQLAAEPCTHVPPTAEHQWLRDLACGWYEAELFNIILTPDYNASHYNHFHVDLTPDAHFIG